MNGCDSTVSGTRLASELHWHPNPAKDFVSRCQYSSEGWSRRRTRAAPDALSPLTPALCPQAGVCRLRLGTPPVGRGGFIRVSPTLPPSAYPGRCGCRCPCAPQCLPKRSLSPPAGRGGFIRVSPTLAPSAYPGRCGCRCPCAPMFAKALPLPASGERDGVRGEGELRRSQDIGNR